MDARLPSMFACTFAIKRFQIIPFCFLMHLCYSLLHVSTGSIVIWLLLYYWDLACLPRGERLGSQWKCLFLVTMRRVCLDDTG